MNNNGDSLLRILISTDNHLGVWEKDEERKLDSFRAFEEVLQIAIEQNVDMLLLGGDLYHDNKPSRTTVVKSIELLNKYCLGERPVRFQVLSDQKQNFVSGVVNFHHPHLNIGLPVFTIHGNHDDPAGQDNLSAVDLLSTCGLVNYFGKVLLSGNNMGNITLSPVLLQKGNTKLALYGLGNVRDERLGRLFQTPGCVQWLRPAATDSIAVEDWINVFVLHQNRVQHGATAKNCLQERHLPAFMDLVIWGHEHECIPEPQPLQAPDNADADKAFVIQPGSTVATALSEGESKAKHVILLEVMESQWRSIKLPLSTVRPFVWDNIVLAAQQPQLDPTDTAAISALLERKVTAMIQQANRDAPQQQQQQPGPNQGPLLPLIRLRVDYSGFTTINSQRFGAKFVGKVSNPHDMVLWAKAPARRAKEEGRAGQDEELAAAAAAGRPEQLDQARIEDLVAANLVARLDILPPDELALALHEFVEKDEKAALAACVTQILQETQAAALTRPGNLEQAGSESAAADPAAVKDEDVASLVQQSVHNRSAIKAAGGTPSAAAAAQGLGGSNPLGLTPISRGPAGRVSDDSGFGVDVIPEDNMDIDQNNTNNNQSDRPAGGRGSGMPPLAPKGRGRGRKGASAAGGMRQAGLGELFNRASQQGPGSQGVGAASRSNLEGYLGGGGATEGLEDLDFDHAGVNPSPRSRGRNAGNSKARGGAGGRGGRGRGRGRKAVAAAVDSEEDYVSDEGISDDDDDDGHQPPTKRAKVARPRRAAATAADNRRRSKAAAAAAPDDDDLIDDSDNEMTPMTARGGRTAATAGDEDINGLSDIVSDEISDDSQTQRHTTQGGGGRRSRLTATPATGRTTPAAAAGRASGSQQTAGGRQRSAAASRAGVSQATPATAAAAAATQEDGGFVGSSDDEGQHTAPQPASRPAAAAAAGGGRRRVLPASIGNSQSSGR